MRTAHPAVRTSRHLACVVIRLLQWAVVLSAVTSAIALAALPHLGVYRTLTVLSGSMAPTFRPGDIVVVRPEALRDVRVGQVIAYQVPVGARQVETHRVIKILRGRGTDAPVIRTKGDANAAPDPFTAQLEGTTAWRLEGVIPKAGYALNALRGRAFHLLAIFVIPALLAIFALRRLWASSPSAAESDA